MPYIYFYQDRAVFVKYWDRDKREVFEEYAEATSAAGFSATKSTLSEGIKWGGAAQYR